MATETTVKNIRAPQEIFDRLKALTDESFPNQGAALEALLNSWETQMAKAAIPSRETDIADFDSHLQAIQRAFIHSLEVAQNADARARDAFRKEVESLRAEKLELRQKLEEANAKAQQAGTDAKAALESVAQIRTRAENAERHAATLEKTLEAEKASAAAQIADKEKLAHSLTAQVAEMSERARENSAAIGRAESLKAELEKAKRELDAAAAAAQIAAAKAEAEKALAVSAARDEYAAEVIRLMNENAALNLEIAKQKGQIAILEKAQAADAALMNDQPTPQPPKKDAAKRQKATPKREQNGQKKAASKQETEEKKEIPGLAEAQNLIDAWDKYQAAFQASFEGENAVGGMTNAQKPQITVEDYLKDHPAAAAYLRAENESLKTNYELSAIGKRALDAIKANPDEYAAAIAQMEADLHAYSNAHMWD